MTTAQMLRMVKLCWTEALLAAVNNPIRAANQEQHQENVQLHRLIHEELQKRGFKKSDLPIPLT